jgi:hypothetical protein
VVDLVKGNSAIFEGGHDNGFYDMVLELTGEQFVADARESIITASQRAAIVRRYSECNEWVRRIYFPKRDSLFSPIGEGHSYLSETKIDQEQKAFLATLMYKIYKRLP